MQKRTVQTRKITFVLGSLTGGGAERVASILINEWFSRGHDITLITRLGPENDFFNVPDNIPRIVLGGEGESKNKLTALLKNIPFVWRLRKAIKKADNPVVISFLTKPNIHTLLATFGLGKRVIISERNDTTRQNYPWPWPQLRKRLYKYADVVTANSAIALKGMKGYVPENKLKFVPNPVVIHAKKALPHASEIILNVGRLVPHKGQHILLEAFSKLDENTKNRWACSFLGDGEEKENLQKTARQLHISDNVTLHGLVQNPAEYYLKAGIFVLSSEYEGTPNVLLEAMAHGLPCIVSDCLPGALEYINDGENGLVFNAGDADDLFAKLNLLINNSYLRKTMGQHAAKRVEYLSVDNVMQVWETLFEHL